MMGGYPDGWIYIEHKYLILDSVMSMKVKTGRKQDEVRDPSSALGVIGRAQADARMAGPFRNRFPELLVRCTHFTFTTGRHNRATFTSHCWYHVRAFSSLGKLHM
jgi:hypothetical protein